MACRWSSIVLLFLAGCSGTEPSHAESESESLKLDGFSLSASDQTIIAEGSPEAQLDESNDAPEQAGIGVALRRVDGNFFIAHVIPGTPAAASAVIHRDDRLIAIAESGEEPIEVTGMGVSEVVGTIRGTEGSIVRLTLLPVGNDVSDSLVVSLPRVKFKELSTFVDGRLLPISSKAPNFKFTRLIDGGTAELSEFSGRILVIEFWATWCKPCVELIDELKALPAQHPEWNGKVELLWVSVDEERDNAVKLFHERNWASDSLVWAGIDALKKYRIGGLPTIFVLDEHGNVAAVDHRLDVPVIVESLLRRTETAGK
jgi:thiol-disulfide isomerase/thioredoxin